MAFPDVEEGLFRAIDGVTVVTETGAVACSAYLQLPVNFADAAVNTAAVLIYDAGGGQTEIEQTTRPVIEVYGVGTQPLDVCKALVEDLGNKPLMVEGVGLFDSVDIEVGAHRVPYPVQQVTQASATLRVVARAVF